MIGIEIADQYIKLVEIVKSRKGPMITNFAIEEIPAGLIQNGVIQQEDELHKFLKKIKKKQKLRSRKVNLAINSPNILLRPIQMPKLEKRMLKSAIEMEIANTIQLPFQTYTYDYVWIPTNEDELNIPTEEVQKQELLLIIASRDMLDGYVDVFEKLGLKVTNIDLAPISFIRLLQRERNHDMPPFFIGINFHQHFAEVSIFNNGILRLSRNIMINRGTYLIEETAEHDQVNTFDSAAYATDLIREIERILNFFRYTLNHREQLLNKIVIAGYPEEEDEPITEALSSYFQVSVSQLSAGPLLVYKRISRGYNMNAPYLTIPTGLALKDVKL